MPSAPDAGLLVFPAAGEEGVIKLTLEMMGGIVA